MKDKLNELISNIENYSVDEFDNNYVSDLLAALNLDSKTLFTGTDISNGYFSGLYLKSINFEGANLSRADFSGTVLDSCNFDDANLSNTNFAYSTLINCSFSNANINAASFDGVMPLPSELSTMLQTNQNMDTVYVLVVDDREESIEPFLDIFAEIKEDLQQPNIEVQQCESLQEANDYLNANKYNLVLVDSNLPPNNNEESEANLGQKIIQDLIDKKYSIQDYMILTFALVSAYSDQIETTEVSNKHFMGGYQKEYPHIFREEYLRRLAEQYNLESVQNSV